MTNEIRTPQLTVVSGPMGGGKNGSNRAVMNGLKVADLATWGSERVFSVSETSRGRRLQIESPDEYVFDVEEARFEKAKESGDLMETVCHSDTWYGSPTPPEGQPTHLEIEVTGVRQIVESVHPRVAAARVGMKAIYLLQSSMPDLYSQISQRQDDMTEEKKLQRISRYPAEILYILEHGLPYAFIMNLAGRPDEAQTNAVKYMLGDQTAKVESERVARAKAADALLWLSSRGIKPVEIK